MKTCEWCEKKGNDAEMFTCEDCGFIVCEECVDGSVKDFIICKNCGGALDDFDAMNQAMRG